MTFTYWSNFKTWHEKKLLRVGANDILEADKIFAAWSGGKDPIKTPWISVTIEFYRKRNGQRGLILCPLRQPKGDPTRDL